MKLHILLAFTLVFAMAGMRPVIAAPSPADLAFDEVMKHYLALHGHLTMDHFDDASRKEAAALNVACSQLQQTPGTTPAAGATQIMVDRSAELTKANLAAARTGFANLGDGIDAYLKGFYHGNVKYYRYFCDMMKKPWAQSVNTKVLNPFYDAPMRSCGRLVQ